MVQKSNLRWTILFLLIIIIPLVFITSDTVRLEKRKDIVEKIITAEIPMAKVQAVNISEEGDIVMINITLRSTKNIYKYQVEDLTKILSDQLGNSVLLKISVIPVVEAGHLFPYENSIMDSVQLKPDSNRPNPK